VRNNKGGEVYDMEQYFGDHVRERIIPQIDMIALTRSVSMLHQLKSSGQDMGIFVNISQYSLISETYLGNILEILDESPSLKNRLFIELSQECITKHSIIRVPQHVFHIACHLSFHVINYLITRGFARAYP
jgi:EAL domain-containing protein (putative c-di-GMP-specific phosphodiesterase class I)